MNEPLFVIDDKRIWCIDQDSGQVTWKQSVGGFFKGGKIQSVMLDGERLLVCMEFHICCFDARTGQELWSTELEGISDNKSLVTQSHPVVNRTPSMQ
jgi:outer membrane protein assembly factor BamB